MRPGALTLGLLIVVLLVGAARAQAASPVVRQQDGGAAQDPVDRTRAVIQTQAAEAREEIDALRVAQASLAATADGFHQRLAEMGAAASKAGLERLTARTAEVDADLDELLLRSRGVLSEVDALASRIDALEAELLGRLDGASTPRLQDLVDMDEAASSLVVTARELAAGSDALVAAMARLAAGVEDVRRTLDQSVGFSRPEVRPDAPEAVVDLSSVPLAEVVTSEGTLVLSFRPDVAPRHVDNFLSLARSGFYDGLTFHRVIPGFVVQGGCPVGDGSGGPGHSVAAEFNALPHRRGTLSMARFGHPDSAGSQFFITLDDWSGELDRKYTVFGRLLKGYDTLDRIAALGTDGGQTVEPVGIVSITIRPRTSDDVQEDPTARSGG